uniref:F-box domain-containing protein n=2 Tax=Aegilops tauschii subsp. strangulata TaxID=200361 RepID=A0A453T281_AEGTS
YTPRCCGSFESESFAMSIYVHPGRVSKLKYRADGYTRHRPIPKPTTVSAMASPAMLPSLPDDLISEILSWLPVKSACRFCCVSRGWHALISGPAFVATHRSRTDPQLLLLATSYHHKEDGRRSYDLQLLDVDGKVVRVNKSVGAFHTTCYGRDDAPVCVTFGYCEPRGRFVAKVINPATGSLLMS